MIDIIIIIILENTRQHCASMLTGRGLISIASAPPRRPETTVSRLPDVYDAHSFMHRYATPARMPWSSLGGGVRAYLGGGAELNLERQRPAPRGRHETPGPAEDPEVFGPARPCGRMGLQVRQPLTWTGLARPHGECSLHRACGA